MAQHEEVHITNISVSEPVRGCDEFVSVSFDGHTGNINVTGFCRYASITTDEIDVLIRELRQAQADRVNYKARERKMWWKDIDA